MDEIITVVQVVVSQLTNITTRKSARFFCRLSIEYLLLPATATASVSAENEFDWVDMSLETGRCCYLTKPIEQTKANMSTMSD